MAAAAKQEKAEGFPTEFPPETLFVAVSDRDGPAAGFDGGPEKGGTGAWPKGDIRTWTAAAPVPLAIRDPKIGTIEAGWLEPVEQMGEKNGRPVALQATKFYGSYDVKSRSWVPAVPTERARKRATLGAATIATPFQALAQQQAKATRLAGAGINVG